MSQSVPHADISITKDVTSTTIAVISKTGGYDDLVVFPKGEGTELFELRNIFEEIIQEFHNTTGSTNDAAPPIFSMGQANNTKNQRSSSSTGEDLSHPAFQNDMEGLFEQTQNQAQRGTRVDPVEYVDEEETLNDQNGDDYESDTETLIED